MIVLPVKDGVVIGEVPRDAIRCVLTATECTVYMPGDDVPLVETAPDPDAQLRAQYKADAELAELAAFEEYRKRAGMPALKAVAVKVAAEKLGVLDVIESAVFALVEKAADKAIYVWWSETPTISRGDTQWQQIEPAVDWGKATAGDLFDLAAQI